MNDDRIKKCIISKRLKLSTWNRVNHFGLAALFLLIPILFLFLHLIDYFKGHTQTFSQRELLFLMSILAIGSALYIIQARRLRFHIISSKLTKEECYDRIRNIAKGMNWTVKNRRGNIIVLDTHSSYFDWQMGDRVTIIFDAEKILINSICDPATKASMLGAGRHRHNIRTIVDGLTRASC